ncbi:MAG TPA: DUF309 domain-containing protein [Candidatus Binataceae bacterium]|nr:DUF309 domain-containing protein [Candidatus Binataceae bacterium]
MGGRGQRRDWFAEGIALFNDARYFECHEAWEQVWLREQGDEKRFVQGLIQVAVAILHAERGNFAGAKSLSEKGLDKLKTFPSEHRGIALGDLRDALSAFFAEVIESAPADLPTRPKLRVC